ncbi:KH domain-containing, RNA-binding, signal transduction-associated protein 2 isoform X2 [Podarcis raffonei]|uniref:KH domain-containing, RNA-binding, signal transduction-associated protein 2 isoform X2 n=1 Tax=Podarcis raffonei TaxID=65483 RepID=UPI0023299220|nr:KH domain-containing, RNA-binding, signal transduction-associated protein 2 isoform X2 [Podarcis raffonei]
MEQEKYLPELMAEKDTLDSSFVHAMRLLAEEIEKFQSSDEKKEDEEKKYLDVISNKNIKLSERVLIPVKQYPKFNFVGKLLGPRGNSLKRLQEETGAKMSILGKGSMRDKAKEEELRKSGEAKYAHLSDELHVLIEVFAPPGEAYSRMSHALEEIKKFLVPDYNDEIRQEQLRELSYLNGSEESARGRAMRGRGIRVPPAAPSRGRGSAIPPPPPPGRGAQVPRGTPATRGVLPVPPVARGVPAPRARGVPAVPGYRPPPPPAHEPYEEYGYDDGYGGEYDEPIYEAYDNSYTTQTQSLPEYYDYGHGTSEDAYDSYAQEEWAISRPSLKAPPSRSSRGGYREHPYGRY